MKILATSPSAHIRFQTTGRLPEGVVPRSPLITLLESLAPRDRELIQGLTIDQSLGYGGSRQFASASSALQWIKPSREVFGSFPAESWRIKAFGRVLHLDDLQANASNMDARLFDRYPRLVRPITMFVRAQRQRGAP